MTLFYKQAAINLYQEAVIGMSQKEFNEFAEVNADKFSLWLEKKGENLYTRPGLTGLLEWEED